MGSKLQGVDEALHYFTPRGAQVQRICRLKHQFLDRNSGCIAYSQFLLPAASMPRSFFAPFLFALVGSAPLAQTADLVVEKRATTDEVEIGAEATFYIAVRNDGPDAATEVVLEDVLPAGLAFADARPSRGSYDPASGAWSLDSLAAGSTAVLNLTTIFLADASVQNCAAVRTSGAADEATANNTSCAVVRPTFKSLRPTREQLDPMASATLLR